MGEIRKNKVNVDTPNCISCGACIALCPEVFKFDDNNKTIIQKQPENEDELMCSKQAEAACPVAIIHVESIQVVNDKDYKSDSDNKKAA